MTPTDMQSLTAKVKELDALATAGPWSGYKMVRAGGEPLTPAELGEYLTKTVEKSARESGTNDFLFISVQKEDGPADVCHVGNGPTSPHNTALIAFYRTAAPLLAAEVERLTKAVEDACDVITHDAPHEPACYLLVGWPKPAKCDCWKSRALSTLTKEPKSQP